MKPNQKKLARLRRARRARSHMRTLGAVRLCVHRTPRHIYAQVISADGGTVLAAASTLDAALRDGATGNVKPPRGWASFLLSALWVRAFQKLPSIVPGTATTVVSKR